MLDALADAEKITVSEAELTERIIADAQQYRMAPQEFATRLQEAGQLGAVFAEVRRTKALLVALRAAAITDATGAPVDLDAVFGGGAAADEGTEESVAESAEESTAESVDAVAERPAASPAG